MAETYGEFSRGGQCNICGQATRFYYDDKTPRRESLTCQSCITTSRYRSIARGILKAIEELTDISCDSLAGLPKGSRKTISVYDTQPAFYYATLAYPPPDLLDEYSWIDVTVSQFKPDRPLGSEISPGVINQNLEQLTFPDEHFDIVITSDVMEHVRLDALAHREIYRVLKPGGIYLFTVPHVRGWPETLTRVRVNDPDDPSKDEHLLEPEYHGDSNSTDGKGVLSYRTYGIDLDAFLNEIGFETIYSREDQEQAGIMDTELFYCRKKP